MVLYRVLATNKNFLKIIIFLIQEAGAPVFSRVNGI